MKRKYLVFTSIELAVIISSAIVSALPISRDGHYGWTDIFYNSTYRLAGMIWLPITFILAILSLALFITKRNTNPNKGFYCFQAIVHTSIVGVVAAEVAILFYNLNNSDGDLLPAGYSLFFLFLTTFFLSLIICIFQYILMAKTKTKKSIKILREKATEKLFQLKTLFDQGLITKEEFDEKKQKYIDLL